MFTIIVFNFPATLHCLPVNCIADVVLDKDFFCFWKSSKSFYLVTRFRFGSAVTSLSWWHLFFSYSKSPHWPPHGCRSRESEQRREGEGPLSYLLPVADRTSHEDRLQQRYWAPACRSGYGKNKSLLPQFVLLQLQSQANAAVHCVKISSTLSWSLYELSRHPEVQASLRQEVLNVLEGRRTPEAADVARMPLLKATVKEVLRYQLNGFRGQLESVISFG